MKQGLLQFNNDLSSPHADKSQEELFSSLFRLSHNREDTDLALRVLDAYRIKISHVYDKLTSLSNSRTRLLPHQIEATHRVVNSLQQRFILADEVGLGKTIEAGLIIKELMFRKGYTRIIIITPATLSVQWQQEMKNKFNEEFVILNRGNFSQICESRMESNRIITSIDFIKHPRYTSWIDKTKWDTVIFDEAHRLRRDYSKVTSAYAFAERISQKCKSLLLLTATPFRGKLEELFFLIRLIDPHIFGPHASFVQEYVVHSDAATENRRMDDLREKLSRVLLRRRKVEVGGFTKRFARTVRFDLSHEERLFYDETTEYVKREYNLAMQNKNRAVGFVMIVFQKLLDSSTRALLSALERRKEMLEQRMLSPIARNGNASDDVPMLDIDDYEALDEIEDAQEITANINQNDPLKTLREIRHEILTLKHLIRLGRSIKVNRKLQKLTETLERLRKEGHRKFIIFTQFRTTQDYLYEHLEGFQVTLFHGSLTIKEKESAIEEFKNKTEVLICTEAGGEGRNLQFANFLFNYDLPWSPLKIEQRIGRIHRFGQSKDVYIFNFATKDTVAERVLEVLTDKIHLFEQSIGASDVLLGTLEEEGTFQSSLISFITEAKSKEELEQELNLSIELAQKGYGKLNDLVTPQCMDFNLDDYYAHTRKNRSIENNQIENITLHYLTRASREPFTLKANPDADNTHKKEHNATHGNLKGHAPDYICTDMTTQTIRGATFRSELALDNDAMEFLAVGHPLVDRALNFFLKHEDRHLIAPLPACDSLSEGYYFIYLCRFINGLHRSELLSCMVREDDSSMFIPPEILIPAGADIHTLYPPDIQLPPHILNDDEREKITTIGEKIYPKMQTFAEERAVELKKTLHSVFKREEYKIEISYGKKIRQLEEKRDRQKLKYRMEPGATNRAAVTRTENELNHARYEMQLATEKMRRESNVEVQLEPLLIFRIFS